MNIWSINMSSFIKMANACFATDNSPGQNCKNAILGLFQIPTGGQWVDIGPTTQEFKVTYFKFAAKLSYLVKYENKKGPIFSCSCPDFQFNDRDETKTCCKHIQAVIDKKMGIVRAGDNYEKFLVEHIT
jgi:predicted nucleic acid-binding Zn finger protein